MKRRRTTDAAPRLEPTVSVLMPCRNAMPWLTAAVRSVLTQRDVALELIVGDDASADGSRAWLLALERAMAARAVETEVTCLEREGGTRGAEAEDDEFEAEASTDDATKMRTYDVEEVAKVASGSCTMKVIAIDRDPGVSPSGQGLALNACFEASSGAFVGEMESDDLRPPHAFASLVRALQKENPEWDCVTSQIRLCGWEREGMKRFERWQNGLLTPEDLARERFLEIPALRASALFRREKLNEFRAKTHGGALYRDLWFRNGTVLDFAASPAGEAVADAQPHRWWPVDSDFWHRWFQNGFNAGKVPQKLYWWRQYANQSTRTHSRCSHEQLRKCKAYFFAAAALDGQLPYALAKKTPVKKIVLYGVGETLRAWCSDLQLEITAQTPSDRSTIEINATEHKPGWARWAETDADASVVHAFVFGMAPARAKIARAIDRSFKSLPESARKAFNVVYIA
ncbi:Glycosyl transferase, family 2 [Ostreococcus tauri]|uniref:Glycosyl transferase, family 2 n=1 Tax=Ostreococcus tauri TaxID=70448 RepID=Q00ZU0_OSTTA|nr:Glycosyl transferase, family 2 [Ostreococcus tauri]CAL56192.1 Glycosyl transferase, family 2 [Ostreococcus tauri]|eukprot:XP_003081668.1 Glycosyl transferase, family 2 [Ostreococcus tauri]